MVRFLSPYEDPAEISGHVLCDKCLFESLLAAVKRQHDPLPQPRAARGGRGRGRGRIISYIPTRTVNHPKIYPIGGPSNWTADTLRNAWYRQLERQYNRQLAKIGMGEENWPAAREADPMAPVEDAIVVREVLKGVWAINGEHFVIEGECPVSGGSLGWSWTWLMRRCAGSTCPVGMGRKVLAGLCL